LLIKTKRTAATKIKIRISQKPVDKDLRLTGVWSLAIGHLLEDRKNKSMK